MSFGGFGFPQAKTSLENFQGPATSFFYATDIGRETKSSTEWAPFQFHNFRKKDEPLTLKKVLKEKTFSFEKSLMERNK